VEEFDIQVLDLFLEKFPDFRFATHFLVVAAKHTIGESFRAILERAKEQSVLPTDEVLEAVMARSSPLGPSGPPLPPPGPPGMPHPPPPPPRLGSPNLGMVKLVLDANQDCLTEIARQSALRLDTADVETFKFLFQHRLWPPGLIQSEFRTLMRRRPPVSKIRFLLEQPGTFVDAAEHFEEFCSPCLA